MKEVVFPVQSPDNVYDMGTLIQFTYQSSYIIVLLHHQNRRNGAGTTKCVFITVLYYLPLLNVPDIFLDLEVTDCHTFVNLLLILTSVMD